MIHTLTVDGKKYNVTSKMEMTIFLFYEFCAISKYHEYVRTSLNPKDYILEEMIF